MDPNQTSDDLLAHFDRPKTLDLPDFEWVDEVVAFDATASVNHSAGTSECANEGFIEVPRITRRGICWVLAWSGAIAVLTIAASVLVEFAYVLAAERTLAIAARAGAIEATLPRATCQSVTATVERRLTKYPLLAERLQLSLVQNGALVQGRLRQTDGDRFAVTLSAPNSSVIPDWLRPFVFWRSESRIEAHAERQMPGRKLAFGTGLQPRS